MQLRGPEIPHENCTAQRFAYKHALQQVHLSFRHRSCLLLGMAVRMVLLSADADQGKSLHPKFTAKICDFGLAVSILDPYFGFRQDSSELPGGLVSTRIDSEFHEQM